MKNISFGQSRFVEFMINGDPERVIRIDPADYGIVNRLREAEKAMESAEFAESVDGIVLADAMIREQIDKVFAAPVSDVAFGVANVLTPVDAEGTMMFEAFMHAIVPEILAVVEDRQRGTKERIKSYTAPYVKEE